MEVLAIGLYLLVGFAYYLTLRLSEGPQGLFNFVASVTLGGLQVAVTILIVMIVLIFAGIGEGLKRI